MKQNSHGDLRLFKTRYAALQSASYSERPVKVVVFWSPTPEHSPLPKIKERDR